MMFERCEDFISDKEGYHFGIEMLEYVWGQGRITHIHWREVDFVRSFACKYNNFTSYTLCRFIFY